MCLEKRKLYTVCGHQSSGIRSCPRQRQFQDDPEASSSTPRGGGGGGGALASKLCCCLRARGLADKCRPPHPYFSETRFGFCCRCQAYYRSCGFASSESDTRDDQKYKNCRGWNEPVDAECVPGKVIFDSGTEYVEDPRLGRVEIVMLGRLVPFCGEDVGGGIQKLEDIRWKTIMWAKEGRKRREWREELEEREKGWEKEERGEEEDERRDVQSGTGHQLDAATEADKVKPVTNKALISSYHNVLARLAASTSEHQSSSLFCSHSQETDLTHVNIGEHDNDEHERLIDQRTPVEQNDTTDTADDLQHESLSDIEDLRDYDYHQLSEILEERSSQYTKSRPSKDLSSKPSSGSTSGITAAGQSPILRKKTGITPAFDEKQSSSSS
ncbi:hypothetical protein N0V85_007773 [Neurospora sp. IMI 360204]|nr:hypothetical protein N0V85_007773 [Neurospora sp. IMI 360204]